MSDVLKRAISGTLSRRQFLQRAGTSAGAFAVFGGLGGLLDACQSAPTGLGQKQPLVVALSTDVDVLDSQVFRNDTAYILDANLYGQLVMDKYVEHNGQLDTTGDFEGVVAESWSYSSDRKTVTFKIKKGLKFADGSPLTANDFLYTWKRVFEGPGYVKYVLTTVGVRSEDAISAPDPYTFVVRRDYDSPMFLPFLAWQGLGAMPEKTGKEHATADDPWAARWFAKNANSSGPYVIESWTPGDRIVLAPNPNFARPDMVANSKVIFKIVPSAESRIALVKGGSIDIAQNLSFKDLKSLESDSSVRVWKLPGRRLTYVGFNLKIGPFTDINLRRAIQKAIPYGAIIENVLYGFGQVADSIVSHGMPGQKAVFTGKQDLNAAKAALSASSYKGEKLTLSVRQSQPYDQASATYIQDALRNAGINAQIDIVPDVNFQERLGKKALPFFIMDWQSLGNDGFYQAVWNCHSGQATNYTDFSDPQVDALIDQGLAEGDPGKRADLLGRVQDLWASQVAMAPLFQVNNAYLTGKKVVGINNFYDPGLDEVMFQRKS